MDAEKDEISLNIYICNTRLISQKKINKSLIENEDLIIGNAMINHPHNNITCTDVI